MTPQRHVATCLWMRPINFVAFGVGSPNDPKEKAGGKSGTWVCKGGNKVKNNELYRLSTMCDA